MINVYFGISHICFYAIICLSFIFFDFIFEIKLNDVSFISINKCVAQQQDFFYLNQSISFVSQSHNNPTRMPLKQKYKGKCLLITGTTGFLGKVLLEKILYSLPEVEMIYVLIRGKKGSTLLQRFKKEILSSPCFDRIRNIYEHKFNEFIDSKVKPIEGDLTKQNLGLSQQDMKVVIETCNVMINCAASIDFNARLDHAIESNIKGTLRVSQLARNMKNLDVFTHISTCYVNCNLQGLVREEIFQSKSDPEQDLRDLMKIPLKQLIDETPQIIKGYPNTYTFTKALCERILKKLHNRDPIPICIVRPAIINTSYAEPFPGWMDSIAAAAALYLFSGLGIIKQLHGHKWLIGDTIPVDIVVANIIVASAYNMKNTSKLNIYHVGSSDRNPITWSEAEVITTDYWKRNVSQSRLSEPTVFMSGNKYKIMLNRLSKRVPVWMYAKMAPYMGKQHMKNVSKMLQGIQRADQIEQYFKFFMTRQWIYQSRNMKEFHTFLTTDQRKEFLVDVADIDMRYFLLLNNYGLQKYILKETVDLPTPENSNILKMRDKTTYFSDIKWALNDGGVAMKQSRSSEIKSKILSTARVLQAIQEQALKRLEFKTGKVQDQKKLIMKQANNYAIQIIGEFKMPVVRFMAWTMHKIFKKIYEKVNLNKDIFDTFRDIQQNMGVPIILAPTNRSYIDFLIVSYIFFAYKLKLPYIVSDQAFLSMKLIPFLIRSSGAFFYRKASYKNSKVYKAIFYEYIHKILMMGNNLEFFIEGTRSRTGKILQPEFEVLQIIMDAVLMGKISDVCIVPLTINYEKVLEGDTFPSELLGEQKVEESLLRVVKSIPLLKVNYGRVYVEFCNPIFVNQFVEKKISQEPKLNTLSEIDRKKILVESLGYHIVYKMTEKLVIMSTGVVSAVLLMHRRGITEDLLLKTVHWLSKYIVKKGYKIGGINENSAALAVRNAMVYLSQITKKTKNSIFELQIRAGQEFQKILMLSYYRNTIVHAFLPQAFIGCALASFGSQLNSHDGVQIKRLHEQTNFLMKILSSEYVLPFTLTDFSKFNTIVEELVRNGIISFKEESNESKIVTLSEQQKMIYFYCSLVRPLIECYWAVIVYLMTIAQSADQKQEVTSMDKFFNYIQWYLESLYEEKVIENYEACSLETIRNAFKTYTDLGLVKTTQVSKKEHRIEIISPLEKFTQLESNLKNFNKSMVNNSFTSPMEIARSSVIGGDLSKL